MRNLGGLVVAASFVVIAAPLIAQGGAATPERPPTAAKASVAKETPSGQNRALPGDVFIVTAGGMSYKLGLVTVSAITEGVVLEHLDRKKRQSEAEISKLQPEIDAVQTSYDRLLKDYFDDVGSQAKKAAWEDAKSKLADLSSRRQHLLSPEFVYDGLGPSISIAKTDADGKFTIQIPSRGRIAIAARSSRQTGQTTEKYFWIVWADAQTKRLMLSNDNMMGSGSPESAWR
jgi:hypothetical protein